MDGDGTRGGFSVISIPLFIGVMLGLTPKPISTTVSLRLNHDVAARAAREFSDDGAGQQVAQGGDGIGHVTLGALGFPSGCNLGVGKVFLSERSFFWSRYV